MKNAYPSREKCRWEHALRRPLFRNTTFEVIELMRADLFEYLDTLTTDPGNEGEGRDWLNNEIQRIADRLKELTPHRARAARAAMKAGRVDYACNLYPDEDYRGPHCGPFSGKAWEEFHRQWQDAR